MDVNQINTARNNNITAPSLLNRREGILDSLVRGIRTVLTSPLTLAAGLVMTLPLAAATRTTQARQGNGALQASDGNALGMTQPPPEMTTTKLSSASVTEHYDLPVDVAAVTAAAKRALATNGKVDVSWMLYDDICEAGLNQLLFNGDKKIIADATTWRADVAGTIHLRTALTPMRTARALGITVRDALTGEDCVQSMYVDAFNMPDVEQRLEAREEVLAKAKDPSTDGKRCLRVEDTVIEGRNLQGVSIFQAHLEKCTPTNPAPSEHTSAKKNISAANMTESTSTPDTSKDAAVLQKLADSIVEIRAEHCPTSMTIIHGNSTNTQRELTTLQAQIHALCPKAIINTFSSLNASLPSSSLGANQLAEHLARLLASKTNEDVYVISPPPLTTVEQNTQALEQIIGALEAWGVTVFSATKDGWINSVGGVQHGGNTAVKIVFKNAVRSVENNINTLNNGFLLPVILVISGIAVILTSAGAMLYNKRTKQQNQTQTLNSKELDAINKEVLETLANSSEQQKQETDVDPLLPQSAEVTADEEQSALLPATSVSNISEDFDIDKQLAANESLAYFEPPLSDEEEDALSVVGVGAREQSNYVKSDRESSFGNSETSLNQPAERFKTDRKASLFASATITRSGSTQRLMLPANQKSLIFESVSISASIRNLSVAAENRVEEENLATEPEQSSVPVLAESAETEAPLAQEEATSSPQEMPSLGHWPPCKPASSLTDVYRAQEKWRTPYQDGEKNDMRLEKLRIKLEAMRKKRENK